MIPRALEADDLGGQMVRVSPYEKIAAEAGRRYDRLYEIAIELRGGEFEIHLAALVPDREEPALRFRADDEARIRHRIARRTVGGRGGISEKSE